MERDEGGRPPRAGGGRFADAGSGIPDPPGQHGASVIDGLEHEHGRAGQVAGRGHGLSLACRSAGRRRADEKVGGLLDHVAAAGKAAHPQRARAVLLDLEIPGDAAFVTRDRGRFGGGKPADEDKDQK